MAAALPVACYCDRVRGMGIERATAPEAGGALRLPRARVVPLSAPPPSYAAAAERYLTGTGVAKSSARIYRVSLTTSRVDAAQRAGADRTGPSSEPAPSPSPSPPSQLIQGADQVSVRSPGRVEFCLPPLQVSTAHSSLPGRSTVPEPRRISQAASRAHGPCCWKSSEPVIFCCGRGWGSCGSPRWLRGTRGRRA